METLEASSLCAQRRPVTRLRAGQWQAAQDDLAEEVPVALEYNGISHAVMLATPADLEAFALGFSLSEGILGGAEDCYGIDAEPSEAGITLRIRISSAAFMQLKDRRRTLAGRTGCGLCGTESLGQIARPLPRLAPAAPLSAAGIRRALGSLQAFQPLNRRTGATHAAVWSAPGGEVLAGFEDVGRHNALDKLIGSMAMTGMNFQDGFALVTSRASVEMVQKAATVRMPALVAISAPTALAARTAENCGMTLLAFARGDEFTRYANGANLRLD